MAAVVGCVLKCFLYEHRAIQFSSVAFYLCILGAPKQVGNLMLPIYCRRAPLHVNCSCLVHPPRLFSSLATSNLVRLCDHPECSAPYHTTRFWCCTICFPYLVHVHLCLTLHSVVNTACIMCGGSCIAVFYYACLCLLVC